MGKKSSSAKFLITPVTETVGDMGCGGTYVGLVPLTIALAKAVVVRCTTAKNLSNMDKFSSLNFEGSITVFNSEFVETDDPDLEAFLDGDDRDYMTLGKRLKVGADDRVKLGASQMVVRPTCILWEMYDAEDGVPMETRSIPLSVFTEFLEGLDK